MRTVLLLLLFLAAGTPEARPQQAMPPALPRPAGETLAERLGYPADAKLLIVHADDLGMAHSVNAASIKALESGLVTSASIMVPCPWLPEIAAYARSHPDADFGLHLTLTSEWKSFRWGPHSPADRVRSLIAPDGYLYPSETEAAAKITPREAETEIRAQIEYAKSLGIKPTHLDSHMGTLYQTRALFETLLRVAREYRLPVRVSREWSSRFDFLPSILTRNDVVLDSVFDAGPAVSPEQWNEYYTGKIKSLRPGVSQVTIHLAFDDEEMRAISVDHPDWGAAWRQRDYEYFTSDEFRRVLKENNVRLITYRELGKLLAAPEPG
jgi:chitin disaccharide deacetylase